MGEIKYRINQPDKGEKNLRIYLGGDLGVNNLNELTEKLKTDKQTAFDYLISHTAVDFNTHFMAVYHLTSTQNHHLLVVKVKIEERENPEIDSLASVYPTSEFFEREVFDLFGIRYKNHPNLKRLFLEDDYGYPLRKDFKDEVNMIER